MNRQYTIRAVPDVVDQALRREARQSGKSLNQVALDALRRGIGLDQPQPVHDDLDHLFGVMSPDPELDEILSELRQIEPELWR